ncbi:MAG: hypothetical protein OXT65_06565 [Alphaproteobacteria bacterium]|nr:hypothetical protein [Alphaproteobacteria bacterium]
MLKALRFKNKINIGAPLAQATRCLHMWLEEEGRCLPYAKRRRAAVLIARYFMYEDDTTDELILSFLRHYSGRRVSDMDNPTTVRLEIKSILDQSDAIAPWRKTRKWMVAGAMVVFLLLSMSGWMVRPMTHAEQEELKGLVRQVVDRSHVAPVTVWAEVKRPLNVHRYQDMTWLQYRKSRAFLKERLESL